VDNRSAKEVKFAIPGQVLTTSGRELLPIANSPPTELEFLKTVASQIYSALRGSHGDDMDAGLLSVHVVSTTVTDNQNFQYQNIFTVPKPA